MEIEPKVDMDGRDGGWSKEEWKVGTGVEMMEMRVRVEIYGRDGDWIEMVEDGAWNRDG